MVRNKQTKTGDRFNIERKIQNLATMGFYCYASLYEFENAVAYFKRNYLEKNQEIALYVLLHLLISFKQKEHFCKVYEDARANGVAPRENLQKTYRHIKENGDFPQYFY